MGYVLAAILLLTSVFSVGLCRSNSHVSPIHCNGQVGLQAVSTSPCRWYINCVLNPDGTITAYHEKCTGGLLFDPVNKVCANIRATGKASGGSRRLVKRQAPPATPDCMKKTISCGGTCDKLRICSQTGVDKFIWKYDIACKGTTPFCQEGKAPTCVSKLPDTCDSGFPCLEVGIFPDLNDCTVYHNCILKDNELKDIQAYCDPGSVFSGSIEDCKATYNVAADCHRARYSVGTYGLAPFPLEPRYYIVCEAGVPKYVSACPDNQEFTAKGQCEVVCKTAGKLVDPDGTDCTTYIDCVSTTSAGPPYKPTVKKCLGGLIFNPTTLKCGTDPCPK